MVPKKLRRALEVVPGFLALFNVVAICRKSFHGIDDPNNNIIRLARVSQDRDPRIETRGSADLHWLSGSFQD
jgi:hypothetical protein